MTASPSAIQSAAEILCAGGLVAFPTETVYGLGADATNGRAVAAIFAAKGRPSFNPLIVHVPDIKAARALCQWSDAADDLAAAFWPGPLSLVMPLRADTPLSELVSAGLPSVALRIPDHPAALALLRATDRPIAAPSANPSGRISPTTAAHVLAGLQDKIDAILDDGSCAVGVESTIVGLTDTPRLLRPGGVATSDLERALGSPLSAPKPGISAPGQIASHYAPSASVRLNARAARDGELFLGFGDISGDLNLSPSADLSEAAANLFACLHTLDAKSAPIAVAPIPESGLGRAVNDRLRRAAAPRA
ncbi:MAG: L-threonylcarbamoyladenylate synthase [Paracoccaceae bacterium]